MRAKNAAVVNTLGLCYNKCSLKASYKTSGGVSGKIILMRFFLHSPIFLSDNALTNLMSDVVVKAVRKLYRELHPRCCIQVLKKIFVFPDN